MKRLFPVLAIALSLSLSCPVYARGLGGFGGGHSFGGFGGGGHSFSGFGGGGHSFSGFEGGHSFGGFGGHNSSGGFGGGFNHLGGEGGIHPTSGGFQRPSGGFDGGFGKSGGFGNGGFNRPESGNRPDFGNGGFTNRPGDGGFRPNEGGWGDRNGGWANHPDQPISGNNWHNNFPTDGGLGHFSNWQNNHTNNFNHFNQNNWNSNSVRNSFNQYNNVNFNHYGGYGAYGRYGGYGAYGYHGGWWGYPGGWYCPGWSAATAWTCVGLSALTSFLGIAAIAGSGGHKSNNQTSSVTNVSYNGGNVYINGTAAGTDEDYYNQAQGLASVGVQYANVNEQNENTSTSSEEWKSLGVFSLVQPGQTQSSMLVQLAINKDGVVRGNYFNQITNENSEVYGSIDKQTQRISFTLGQNSKTVFDTTLHDIMKEDAPVLVHYGPTNTQSMMLVRLKQPAGSSAESS